MATDPDSGEGDDEEWDFTLADIEERESDENGETEPESETAEDSGGNVAGSFGPAEQIEPGDVDLENAVFVIVGVALAVLALAGFMNILP
ncbi:MAG: hypothetical protein ACI8XM_002879 [Haloarculaceae archaeon]|jgi:hypothetical protein